MRRWDRPAQPKELRKKKAALTQAFVQRHVIAELDEIVVPPANGRNPEFGFHSWSPVLGRQVLEHILQYCAKVEQKY